MTNVLKKQGIEGIFLNIMKAHDKPISNNILDRGKLKLFSLKSGMRQGRPLPSSELTLG
jgi:hypothetical protein